MSVEAALSYRTKIAYVFEIEPAYPDLNPCRDCDIIWFMTTPEDITVVRTDPRQPENRALIESLDNYMLALYPAESTHRIDLTTLASENARFYSALLNATVVGCGGILLALGYAEIKRIFVSPQARGLGIGRRLLTALETEARSLDFALLRLETGIYQLEALALFEVMGFTTCSSFGNYPPDDPNSIFMEKRLGT